MHKDMSVVPHGMYAFLAKNIYTIRVIKNTHVFIAGELTVPISIVKRKGHRSFTLSVRAGGRVILTVPKQVSEKDALEYVQQKKEWLQRALKNIPPSNAMLEQKDLPHYKAHKDKAKTFVLTRLAELNKRYGFAYRKVFIRANTSRWGSCSGLGNLNFDYRILFLPAHIQDYLLVHELCHLREMNHSPRFWNLVAQTVPNYPELRRELQRQQM